MASPITRFWLTLVTGIEALFAFFCGVYFSVWGDTFTSPTWVALFSGWHGPRFWGTLFLIFGGLFLFGMEWNRSWPRITACVAVGLLYLAIGTWLGLAPLWIPNSITGSVGMWFHGGALTLCLAGFMYHERRQEKIDELRKHNA